MGKQAGNLRCHVERLNVGFRIYGLGLGKGEWGLWDVGCIVVAGIEVRKPLVAAISECVFVRCARSTVQRRRSESWMMLTCTDLQFLVWRLGPRDSRGAVPGSRFRLHHAGRRCRGCQGTRASEQQFLLDVECVQCSGFRAQVCQDLRRCYRGSAP